VNIALVKLSSLGDVVHALPVAAALRARLPHARLSWIVERREAALLTGNGILDAVVPVDTRGWRRALDVRAMWRPLGALRAGGEIVELMMRHLGAARFDVALDLQGLLKSGLLTAATRAPLRIGFAPALCRERWSALLTNRHVTPPATARHVVEQYLAVLEPLGVRPAAIEFPLPRNAAAEARADAFFSRAGLKPSDRLVALLPGAGRADKRWPADRFAALAARLTAETGASVLVVWGPGEHDTAKAIVDSARDGRALLAPTSSIEELVALLWRAAVVVGGDTGPLHLAAALGVACVGLYGPTAAERNGPWGQVRRALQSPDGTLAGIDVEAVLAGVIAAFESAGQTSSASRLVSGHPPTAPTSRPQLQ
jgi:lipopolysaccharide heptosyltransferase I